MLAALLRRMALVGALSAAFGPSYAFTVLRVAYGQHWSATEAPAALAAYSLYIPILAVNGILEVNTNTIVSLWCRSISVETDQEHSAGHGAGICTCRSGQRSAVQDQRSSHCVRGRSCRGQPRARPCRRSRGCAFRCVSVPET